MFRGTLFHPTSPGVAITPVSFFQGKVLNEFVSELYTSGALISLMLTAGCGSGANGSNPNNVTVAVSPMSVTIPASGEVTLQVSG